MLNLKTISAPKKNFFEKWNAGWNCLFEALNSLTPDDINKIIYIRNQGLTVTEAINSQLAHYSYHTGQIVYIGKMVCDENWKSLSIPNGKSNEFNDNKFSKSLQK